ncbi:MAG: glycosyltransferase family 2 protein [Tannerellaceae bacterium]|nr:glycosyltransferase family 2 protein [Tannerellaceae bacterium]
MAVVTFILLFFTFCQLAVVFYNWLARPFLPVAGKGKEYPSFSILIPARNEADTISLLLDDLAALQVQPVEILVYDDMSTDETAAIVRKAAEQNIRLHLLSGKILPEGWLGKNHACHRLAEVAEGEYLLFLDADVRVSAGFTARLLSYVKTDPVRLLSLFPCQEMEQNASVLSVPLMNRILLTLLPLPLVRRFPQPSLAAANGQCMLFESATYRQLQPHKKMRMTPVEDIAIMRFYKEQQKEVTLLLGDQDIFCRMYTSLTDSIGGFSKNIFSFFGGSPWVAFLFAICTTFPLVWFCLYATPGIVWLYAGMVLLIRILFSVLSRQSVWLNLLLAIPQQAIFWIILCTALVRTKQHRVIWKERNISFS